MFCDKSAKVLFFGIDGKKTHTHTQKKTDRQGYITHGSGERPDERANEPTNGRTEGRTNGVNGTRGSEQRQAVVHAGC